MVYAIRASLVLMSLLLLQYGLLEGPLLCYAQTASEDTYADGYEYEYEYEGGSEVEVEVEVAADSGMSAAEERKEARRAEAARKQQEQQEARRVAQAAEAAQAAKIKLAAQASAEEDQRLLIQRRNQGKRGYKKAVGSAAIRNDLPQLASTKHIAVTQVSTGCVLAADWGVHVVLEEKKKLVDPDQRKLKEIRARAQPREGERGERGDSKAPGEGGEGDEGGEGAQEGGEPGQEDEKVGTKKSKPKKVKKPSFRELQAQKMEARKEKEAERHVQRGILQAGASCENLICGACKVVAEEFSKAVVEGGKEDRYAYVEDVATGFCARKVFQLRYQELVLNTCMTVFADKAGYRDAVLHPVEEEQDHWEQLLEPSRLVPRIKRSCLAMGGCAAANFEMNLLPKSKEQEHWDDKCYVCQAFAEELEERLHLMKGVTETSVQEIVRGGCDRVDYATKEYRDMCSPLVESALLDDISWIAFMHSEAIARKGKVERLFSESLCESVNFCEKWVDPDAEEEVIVEEVFF